MCSDHIYTVWCTFWCSSQILRYLHSCRNSFNCVIKWSYIRAVTCRVIRTSALVFMPALAFLHPCHFCGEITPGGQEMRLSWRSPRLRRPRMHRGPELASVKRCISPQGASHRHCFCETLPARILTRVDCSRSLCSCVNNPLDDSLPPHANIIPQNILPADHSKIRLNRERTLYLFSHITRYISGGAEYRTFKESWTEQCFCFSRGAGFSPSATEQRRGRAGQVGGRKQV